jgi:predicted negative regulator of RcsB-dependent stress response
LGLKENIKAVQEEISTEEQFLEGMIKGERFFKRNKKFIISGLVLIALGAATYAVNDLLTQQRLKASNEAYQTLLKDANNQNALATLKQKNPKLYTMFLFEQALAKNDLEALKSVASAKENNPILADIAGYQLSQLETNSTIGANSELLKDMVLLQEGYRLLLENKVEEARLKLAQVDMNSPLKQVAKNLEHYQGLK